MKTSKFDRYPLANIAQVARPLWVLRTSMCIYAKLRSHSTKQIVKNLQCGEMVGYRTYFSMSS
jgi:hypothetical protein